jgi:hypothetical protein
MELNALKLPNRGYYENEWLTEDKKGSPHSSLSSLTLSAHPYNNAIEQSVFY